MNEDFDKVFEETYKAQYDAYMARKLKMLVQTPTTETKIEGGTAPVKQIAELPNNAPKLGGDEE